jgi:hypothetical protein
MSSKNQTTYQAIKPPYSRDKVYYEEKYGSCSVSCFLCGRDTTEKLFVHYTTDGHLINTREEVENSQGFFPVGSDCAKKLPKDFIFDNI